jgi:hypothetical protein
VRRRLDAAAHDQAADRQVVQLRHHRQRPTLRNLCKRGGK